MADVGGLKWSAVIIGSAVDIGGTMVTSFVIGIVAAAMLLKPGELPTQLQARLLTNAGFLTAEFVVGLSFSCLGGFVAARLAKRRERAHAAMTGAVCLGLGLVSAIALPESHLPLWFRIAGYLLVLPVALLGGALARTVNLRTPAA